jgi:glycerol kinase
MAKYLASIHQGTLFTRCMLFNHSGQVASVSQREHRQIYLQPDRVEHRPLEIWECTQFVVQEALSKLDVHPGDIAAIGVSNQRETTVVWNPHTGRPYYNAIVWQDTRTETICKELALEGGQDRFRPKTGLPLTTLFSGPKLKWIFDNVAGVRQAAENGEAIFGTIDSWLIWWLTGGPDGGSHVIDVTNASRTMLMNLNSLAWDEEILAVFKIPRCMLPRIVSSSDPDSWGSTTLNGPFGEAIPVCGDLGDQQACLIGQTCFEVGEAKNTYGIANFMLLNTGTSPISSHRGLLTTLAYQFGGQPAVYALEGSIATTGGLIDWIRDNLDLIDRPSEIEELAQKVEDNGGLYFVPAFSGLFAPYWRSDARGIMIGLTRFINKGHLARACIEAIAYQTRDVLEAMEKDSGAKLKVLKADGNLVYNNLLMQFQADMLNVPVVRPEVAETASLGAAYAAGLAVGFWANGTPDQPFEDLCAHWQVDRVWLPEMDAGIRQRLYTGWLKAVERSFAWVS